MLGYGLKNHGENCWVHTLSGKCKFLNRDVSSQRAASQNSWKVEWGKKKWSKMCPRNCVITRVLKVMQYCPSPTCCCILPAQRKASSFWPCWQNTEIGELVSIYSLILFTYIVHISIAAVGYMGSACSRIYLHSRVDFKPGINWLCTTSARS